MIMMSITITGAPASWGVDDPNNPFLPSWQRVLTEVSQAGFNGLELGPYGYLPLDHEIVGSYLNKLDLSIIAGTIFDNLLSIDNIENLKTQAHNICKFLSLLPKAGNNIAGKFGAPYLVIIDWGHDERDYSAGHPDDAPRLSNAQWHQMINHIQIIARIAWDFYGIRPVVHPHAGGYIEFIDEIEKLISDIPHETAGLCLDTGHLYYSKMDPVYSLHKYADRIDYLHFKDINKEIYKSMLKKKIRFFEACADGVMCPIGHGCLDYPEIFKALKEIGYCGYITLEQERDPRNAASSLEDVKASVQYLKSLGFR